MANNSIIYRFDHFEIEPRLAQLRQAGEPIHIEPRSFDVLLYLIENRDRLVDKMDRRVRPTADGCLDGSERDRGTGY